MERFRVYRTTSFRGGSRSQLVASSVARRSMAEWQVQNRTPTAHQPYTRAAGSVPGPRVLSKGHRRADVYRYWSSTTPRAAVAGRATGRARPRRGGVRGRPRQCDRLRLDRRAQTPVTSPVYRRLRRSRTPAGSLQVDRVQIRTRSRLLGAARQVIARLTEVRGRSQGAIARWRSHGTSRSRRRRGVSGSGRG